MITDDGDTYLTELRNGTLNNRTVHAPPPDTTTFTLASGTTIPNSWNGTLTSSGSTFTGKNVAWNGAVAAAQTATYGLQASGTAPTGTVAVTCTAG